MNILIWKVNRSEFFFIAGPTRVISWWKIIRPFLDQPPHLTNRAQVTVRVFRKQLVHKVTWSQGHWLMLYRFLCRERRFLKFHKISLKLFKVFYLGQFMKMEFSAIFIFMKSFFFDKYVNAFNFLGILYPFPTHFWETVKTTEVMSEIWSNQQVPSHLYSCVID